MLSGAYSKQHKSMQRSHVDRLKTMKNVDSADIIARSRRLSQETNKRRKAQAVKRKHEIIKEEKRRKEILARRHDEQQKATERFQRAPIPSSRQSSRSSSPTHGITGLEEALKLIRGSSPLSRQSSLVSTGSYKGQQSPRTILTDPQDPLHRPYYARHSSRHLRPQSATDRAQGHAEMLDRSLRNCTDSRSLFEQQLEQHQQLLIEDQKKSLHSFNKAIQHEMELDTKLQGTEEITEDTTWMDSSESLSSIDSLEASQDSGARERPRTAVRRSRADTSPNKPYPQPVKASPPVGRVVPNSASVNMTEDSLESTAKAFQVEYFDKPQKTNYERGAIIGPIISRQVSGMSSRHDEQYQDSEPKMITDPQHVIQIGKTASSESSQIGRPFSTDVSSVPTQVTTTTHIHSIPAVAHYDSNSSAYQPQFVTTSILPSNPGQRQDALTYASAKDSSAGQSFTNSVGHGQMNLPVQVNKITEGQTSVSTNHKTSNSSPSNYSASATRLFSTSSIKAQNENAGKSVAMTKPVSVRTAQPWDGKKGDSSKPPAAKQLDASSITKGTLGLVNGKLTVLANIEAIASGQEIDSLSKKSISDLESREVKSILKRPESEKLRKVSSTGNLQKAGLNVKDSIEITREHQKKARKKSVRFADMHYEEDIPEDTDSVDSNTESAQPVEKVTVSKTTEQGTQKLPPRQRPVSAKVSGSRRLGNGKMMRAASAGSLRPDSSLHSQDRPRAAAHIITHEGHDPHNKKIAVVTNNFMTKVPVTYSKSSPTQGVIIASKNAYTDQNGEVHVTAESVLQKAENVAANFQNKYTAASSQLPPETSQSRTQEVYNENGLRIDRTPTDDEINWLWEKVRTCLNREPTAQEKKSAAMASTDVSRQTAPVSNKYIDGSSMGLTSTTRVASMLYSNSVQQRAMNNMSSRNKPASATAGGGYMRKFGLLQQRRQADSAKKTGNSAAYAPVASKTEPQEANDATHANKEDMTESMANFLAAEHFAGKSLSESQVQLAIEEARRRQQEVRANMNRTAPGPSALSLEEHKIMESLDRLNERLKVVEKKPASSANPGVYNLVHSGGFRGHQPLSHQQQQQQQQRSRVPNLTGLRVQSARQYR